MVGRSLSISTLMRSSATVFCGLALVLWSTTAWGAPPKFPSRVTVAEKTLRLNGSGLCEYGFLGIDLYYGALYVEKPSTSARELILSKQAKRIELRFVRKLTRAQLRQAWSASFKVNAGKRLGVYSKRLGQLNSMMADIKVGQSIVFNYVPEQGLEVIFAGAKKGVIEGEDFARMFVTLYLGDNPPDANMKKAMLRGAR